MCLNAAQAYVWNQPWVCEFSFAQDGLHQAFMIELMYVHRNPGLSPSDTHIMYSQNFYIFAIHKG